MSTYSLVKPPNGCNVTGSEMLNAQLSAFEQTNIPKDQWVSMKQDLADSLVQGGVMLDQLSEDFDTSVTAEKSILYYLTGYVANKGLSFEKCNSCEADLKSNIIPDSDIVKLIRLRDYFGALSFQLGNFIV